MHGITLHRHRFSGRRGSFAFVPVALHAICCTGAASAARVVCNICIQATSCRLLSVTCPFDSALRRMKASSLTRIKVGKHDFCSFYGSLKVLPSDLVRALSKDELFCDAVRAIPIVCWSVHILADEDDRPNAGNAVACEQPIAGLVPADNKEVLLALFNNFSPIGPLGDLSECASYVSLSPCRAPHTSRTAHVSSFRLRLASSFPREQLDFCR